MLSEPVMSTGIEWTVKAKAKAAKGARWRRFMSDKLVEVGGREGMERKTVRK